MRHFIVLAALPILLLPPPVLASSPGDACSPAGAVERDGGQTLICNGTVWKEAEQIANTGRSNAQVGNDTGDCTADKTGRMRYNESTDTWEYCAGTGPAWNPFEDPLCEDDDTGECRVEVDRSDSDPGFIAANIKYNVNILGVIGTHNCIQNPYGSYSASSSGTSTYTFSSVSFGAANTNRMVVAAITGDRGASGRIPTSVTIGGVAATKIVGANGGTGSNTHYADIWAANVPSGTSGNVVVIHSNSVSTVGLSVYSVVMPSTSVTATATVSATASPLSGSINTSGFFVAVAISENGTSFSWTNATENNDSNTGSHQHSSAWGPGAGTVTVTATPSTTTGDEAVAIASWAY